MEKQKVLHPIEALPDKVTYNISVWQVTVNAAHIAVHSCHKPGLVLIIHDMAAATVFGS